MPFARLQQLLGPAALVIVVGAASSFASTANDIYFLDALLAVAMVVSIYVFIGNSGVLSFGHISFVAIGAFGAGVVRGATTPGPKKPPP